MDRFDQPPSVMERPLQALGCHVPDKLLYSREHDMASPSALLSTPPLPVDSAATRASTAVRLPRERRAVARRKALLRRVHAEFEEMPGLSLTLAQAKRLFGLPSTTACARILGELAEQGWLRLNRSGRYVRRVSEPFDHDRRNAMPEARSTWSLGFTVRRDDVTE